jgi:hypothetical protein
MCDADGSGSISLKELEKYLSGLKVGFKNKEIHCLLRRLDGNQNGELSLQEFKEHFSKGQGFFKQEIIASTSSMVAGYTKKTEIPGLRDLFKSLEIAGNAMSILSALQKSPNCQLSVSAFFAEVNKAFSCELNKPKQDLINRTLVLNETNTITYEKFRPIVLLYTSKALGTKENYMIRIKMHLPEKDPNIIFMAKGMTENWFFSREQILEAIQFLANPGDDHIESEVFYADTKNEV